MTNKGVVYKEPGVVAVEEIGYPDLVLRDGPGVNPFECWPKM